MNRKLIFVIAFPIIVLMGVSSFHGIRRLFGASLFVDIRGYDPRDLLSGHFLTFQIDFGSVNPCTETPTPECICLRSVSEFSSALSWSGACDSAPSDCGVPIRGTCKFGAFLTGIERFYFPEEYQSVLSVVPPSSKAELKVSPQGKAALVDLWVGEERILDYAKRIANKR